MRLKSIIHATLAVAAAGALPGVWQGTALAQAAQSDSTFTVGDIRIEGLQRISEGTVYNYLPVNIGDQIDQRRIAEAASFATSRSVATAARW
jgi:outer membrane protein insertion porin family